MASSVPEPTTSGHAPFTLQQGTDTYQTFYKVYGSLHHAPAGRRPLIILHGGPGSTHDYVLPLVHVLHTAYGIPLVFYDQLGSGDSTRLPEKKGEVGEAFWTEEVFMDQLDALVGFLGLDRLKEEEGGFDVLGHSWGGMLAMRWVARRQPQERGLKRLVVSDSPASMKLFVEGALKLREKLPENVRDALNKHEAAGTTDSEEYHAAEQAFYAQHLCRVRPFPEGLQASFEKMSEDSTVYLTMNGPSEFFITGTLKTWSIIADLHLITVPTLLLNGRHDEVQDLAVRPIFEGLGGKARWVTFEQSSHVPFVEEGERYGDIVAGFLSSYS